MRRRTNNPRRGRRIDDSADSDTPKNPRASPNPAPSRRGASVVHVVHVAILFDLQVVSTLHG